MSEGARADVTHHLPDLEVFPVATVRSHWMGGVAAGHEKAWTALDPVPGMTCLTAGPEEITLPQHHDTRGEGPGAQMREAEEGRWEVRGEEVEAGPINLPATQSTSRDRNQEHEEMIITLTRPLAVATASSSEPSIYETH